MKCISILLVASIMLMGAEGRATDRIELANGEWAPYLSENLPHCGAASHIVTEAFSAVGVNTHYAFYPWKRSYKLAREGVVNGTLVWVYTEDRAKDFFYTDVVITDYEYLFHLKEKPLVWKSVEDLGGMTIGATLHTVYPTLETAAAKNMLTIERAGNYDNLYHRLLKHRIDAIPQVSQVGNYYIRTTLSPGEQNRITYSPTVVQERSYHLILSRKNENSKRFVDRFNEGLSIIKSNGTYASIIDNLVNGAYDQK